MEIKVVNADLTDVQKIEKDYSSPMSVSGDNEGEIHSIAVKQVLDVRDGEYDDDDIKTLVKWARGNVGDDITDIKWAIRDLRMRIGTPTYGDAIKNLSRFAYLDMEGKRIEKEKESFR